MSYLILLRIGTNDRQETREESGPRLTIGRGTQSQLRLDHDAVAVEHARIDRGENGRYVLTDLGSVTGSYVNGKRIETAQLAAGDQIAIGPYLIKVELLQQLAGPLILDVRQIRAASEQAESVGADYAAAYGLSRSFFNKAILTWFCTGAALLVLAGVLIAGKTGTFRPGAVSSAHMLIADQCSQCHVPFGGPSEKNCVSCHQGPEHHANQVTTPSCQTCHVEHRDAPALVQVDNRQCVACHADLKTKDASPDKEKTPGGFAKRVTDFVEDHPEFSVSMTVGPTERRVRIGMNDRAGMARFQGAIKLNHMKHLGKTLVGQNRPLECIDCHQPAQDGRLMVPITFEAHCSGCHDSELRVPDSNCRVPHGSVEIVDQFLRFRISENLCQPVFPQLPERRLLYTFSKPQPPMTPSAAESVRLAENDLFRTKDLRCQFCHELTFLEGEPLAKVEKSAIPALWFAHAQFEHKAHRMLACSECHIGAEDSQKTADVLVPGKETCLLCHSKSERGGAFQEASAPTLCAACHLYHPKAEHHQWNFQKTLKDLGVARRDPTR
jgi:hypothetical protein